MVSIARISYCLYFTKLGKMNTTHNFLNVNAFVGVQFKVIKHSYVASKPIKQTNLNLVYTVGIPQEEQSLIL